MIKIDITLPIGYNGDALLDAVTAVIPVGRDELREVRLLRRTLLSLGDGHPIYRASVALSLDPDREAGLLKMRKKVSAYEMCDYTPPVFRGDFRPVVVGSGPCGLLAALTLAESGARPIILERGLPVGERTKKVELFERLGVLDPECNVQFGEGGAGTYSDGKLKCGAMDKYKMKVLREFIRAGADEDIAFSSTAHLGTDKLPGLIEGLRMHIIRLGGEFIFGARLTDLCFTDGAVCAVEYEKDGKTEQVPTRAAILATGHSARDTMQMLRRHGIPMEARGFGIGMRIEHPREYINSIVYRLDKPYINETASYHLVTHLPTGRSVYSFCMCPGGTVVAAASDKDGIVTNGMSAHDRMADNSNAALLVSVTPSDFSSDDPLAGTLLQREIEMAAYRLTSEHRAPVFRLADFLSGSKSSSIGGVTPSYPRGTEIISPDEYLPPFVTSSLRAAIPDFNAWLCGYKYADAVLTGPETRTTSPVRILRDANHAALGFSGVYPAGEGAGYAGGIISSATDGIRTAEKLILLQGK